MDNIITYAEQTLDTFAVRPFCDVDSLILSCVAYLDLPRELSDAHSWKGLPLRDLFRAEHFDRLFSVTFSPERTKKLLTALAASPRFRDVRVMGYVDHTDQVLEKQFSAMTFRLAGRQSFIAFRGTDSTVVGWKEDFNMAFRSPIPSQEEAIRYLTTAGRHCRGEILLGPGFLPHVLQSPGFSRISSRVEKTLPQSSVVGMLLEHQENAKIIKSRTVSLLQHDPFTWVVDNGAFLPLEQLTMDARHVDRTLSTWLLKKNPDERERIVDALFGILETTDIQNFHQLRTDWQKTLPAVARQVRHLDADTRELLFRTLGELALISVKALPETIKKES